MTYKDITICGMPIVFKRDMIENLLKDLSVSPCTINTINSNIIVNAYKNKAYLSVLKDSGFNICDGSVLSFVINKLNSTKFRPYPGPDFFIDRIREKTYTHAFLGSTKEVLKALRSELIVLDKNISDSLFLELPFETVENFDYQSISDLINERRPDFIWVSLGAPKQEIFSSILVDYLNKGFVVSVGAAFNFYSGLSEIKRCPKFLRKLRLEWLYRLYKEPRKTFFRLKREFYYMPIVIFKEILNK